MHHWYCNPTYSKGFCVVLARRSISKKIRGLLAAGLSTATIAEVGSCLRDDSLPTPACAGAVERVRGERERIDQVIQSLLDARAALDDVIRRGKGAGFPTPDARRTAPDLAGRPDDSRPQAASKATGRTGLNLRQVRLPRSPGPYVAR
ncbi:hypothetical protein GCM10023191_054040 [Actinoallomurus oryzae]|uniref:Uncharacterized protein n=1 Tax=Actinoallomurus oryzae TaxID=502180 RepID=A0ABP8QFU6_9ACTN